VPRQHTGPAAGNGIRNDGYFRLLCVTNAEADSTNDNPAHFTTPHRHTIFTYRDTGCNFNVIEAVTRRSLGLLGWRRKKSWFA
jgi:hypothetical protein